MDSDLEILGRKSKLFEDDLNKNAQSILGEIKRSRFLVLGAAGTIGQAVTNEIFRHDPAVLDIVDLSENNLVETVRFLRSKYGYISGSFCSYCLDIRSAEFSSFVKTRQPYDYVLNMAALKHVRSEKDPYTLMRMIDTNVACIYSLIKQLDNSRLKNFFSVSTDKASAPVNLMGASKQLMERALYEVSDIVPVTTARFANVAFSDGSLLNSFENRLKCRQPLVAPNDIYRYFLTKEEAGKLCLLACLLGENRDIFIPRISNQQELISFAEIAKRYLKKNNYTAYECSSEEAARNYFNQNHDANAWPCFFSPSDTDGEKEYEVFYSSREKPDFSMFSDIGVMAMGPSEHLVPSELLRELDSYKQRETWHVEDITKLVSMHVSEFSHRKIGKSLESKM